jgi:nucleotide-binding universal stress UspA family protein
LLTEFEYVRNLIKQLRDKIEADPSNPKRIMTETGGCYRSGRQWRKMMTVTFNRLPCSASGKREKHSVEYVVMVFKDILVVCHARSGLPASVNVALLLAQEHDSHITGYHLVPDIVQAVLAATASSSGAAVPPNIAALERDQEWLMAKGAEAGSSLRELAQQWGLQLTWRMEKGNLAEIGQQAATMARYHDLSIIDRGNSDAGHDWDIVVRGMIRDSGRPVIVMPSIYKGSGRAKSIQVAWDGSTAAARAVHEALPLLKTAKDAAIVTAVDEHRSVERSDRLAKELSEHLGRHGVTTTVQALERGSKSIADVLTDRAVETGADLMVMGGYGHSKLHELLLGSTTDKVLNSNKIPVFLA